MKAEAEHGRLTLVCDGTTHDWELALAMADEINETHTLDVPPDEWEMEYIRITPYLVYTDEDLMEVYEEALAVVEAKLRWGSPI